jgi:hypothetical protein
MAVLNACISASTIDGENIKNSSANPGDAILTSPGEPVSKVTVINPYFFQNGESVVVYNGLFAVGEEGEPLKCDVKLQITDLGEYKDGNLYDIKIEPDGSELGELLKYGKHWGDLEYWDKHLKLGYIYVEATKIYRFFTTDENIDVFQEGKELPINGIVVCQEEELNGLLEEGQKGWNHYIKATDNIRESHYYNTAIGTGYYEHITWEMGVGLIHYNSGYGAEREKIELSIKK